MLAGCLTTQITNKCLYRGHHALLIKYNYEHV